MKLGNFQLIYGFEWNLCHFSFQKLFFFFFFFFSLSNIASHDQNHLHIIQKTSARKMFLPGQIVYYSNVACILLGMILKVICKMPQKPTEVPSLHIDNGPILQKRASNKYDFTRGTSFKIESVLNILMKQLLIEERESRAMLDTQ